MLMGVWLDMAGCSRSSDSDSNKASGSANQTSEPVPAVRTLFNPSSLVELRSLRGYPEDLQKLLGVNAVGYSRIANVGEDCNPTDVRGSGPGRCFLLGGISKSSALIAFKVGSSAGQTGMAEEFVRTTSGWTIIRESVIGIPNTLKQLLDMISVPPDDRKPAVGFDKCFRMVDAKCSY